MKRTCRKTLALFLTAILLFGAAAPCIAFAEEKDASGFLYEITYDYYDDSDKLVLTGYDEDASEIRIPVSVAGFTLEASDIDQSLFDRCDNAEYFLTDDNNAYFSVIDGVLFSKNGKTLIAYPNGSPAESYTVPACCTEIASGAFDTVKYLKTVTVPETVENIAKDAFGGSLTKVTENGLTYYGTVLTGADVDSFSDGDVIAPKDGTTHIAIGAFSGNKRTVTFSLPASLRSISRYTGIAYSADAYLIVNDGLRYIGEYNYFSAEGILTLPESVRYVGDYAIYEAPVVAVKNPDAVLYGKIISQGKIIAGLPGSTAEAYARARALEFVEIGEGHTHSYVIVSSTAATCIDDGVTVFACPCGETEQRTVRIPADPSDHKWKYDSETDDYICKNCGKSYYGKTASECTCICHSDDKLDLHDFRSIFNAVLYRIKLLFWRLTNTHQYCECGNRHY